MIDMTKQLEDKLEGIKAISSFLGLTSTDPRKLLRRYRDVYKMPVKILGNRWFASKTALNKWHAKQFGLEA